MNQAPIIRASMPADDADIAHVIRTVMPEFGASGPGFAILDPEVDAMHASYSTPRAAFFVVELEGNARFTDHDAALDAAAYAAAAADAPAR